MPGKYAYSPDPRENPSRLPIASYRWTDLCQVETVGSCGRLVVNPEHLGAPRRPVAPVACNAVPRFRNDDQIALSGETRFG